MVFCWPYSLIRTQLYSYIELTMCHSVWKSHRKWLIFTQKVKYLVVFKWFSRQKCCSRHIRILLLSFVVQQYHKKLKMQAICIIVCNLAKWDLFMIFKQVMLGHRLLYWTDLHNHKCFTCFIFSKIGPYLHAWYSRNSTMNIKIPQKAFYFTRNSNLLVGPYDFPNKWH